MKKVLLSMLLTGTTVMSGVVFFNTSESARLSAERVEVENNVKALNGNIDMLLRKAGKLYENYSDRAERDAKVIGEKNQIIDEKNEIIEDKNEDINILSGYLEEARGEIQKANTFISSEATKLEIINDIANPMEPDYIKSLPSDIDLPLVD